MPTQTPIFVGVPPHASVGGLPRRPKSATIKDGGGASSRIPRLPRMAGSQQTVTIQATGMKKLFTTPFTVP